MYGVHPLSIVFKEQRIEPDVSSSGCDPSLKEVGRVPSRDTAVSKEQRGLANPSKVTTSSVFGLGWDAVA